MLHDSGTVSIQQKRNVLPQVLLNMVIALVNRKEHNCVHDSSTCPFHLRLKLFLTLNWHLTLNRVRRVGREVGNLKTFLTLSRVVTNTFESSQEMNCLRCFDCA